MNYKSQKFAILLMFICTLISSAAQIFLKFASKTINFTYPLSLINIYFIAGLVCFAFGAIFMFVAFKMGELSVLFPILATGYVWVSLISPFFFSSDSMNLLKWVGIIIILFSVGMLGFSKPKKNNDNEAIND